MTWNRIKFLIPTLACGLGGLLLRRRLLAVGIDQAGLLIRGNVENMALWALTGAFLLGMLVLTRGLDDRGGYGENFPRCRLSGMLAAAGAVALGASLTLGELAQITNVLRLMTWGAAVAMAYTGFCRFTGRRPLFAAHGVVSVYHLLMLVWRYQQFSSSPRLHLYGLQILCGVALMLFAYHRTCCDFGQIRRRSLVFFAMASGFLCLVCLTDPAMPVFYLASGLWASGSMCTLDPISAGDQAG